MPMLRPTLKSCSFPIHLLGEIKNSHEPPAGRNSFFAISLSKKIREVADTIKMLLCIYLYSIFMFNFYVDSS